MIRVVTFLWRDDGRGYRLPRVVDYGPDHVNRMRRMVARHLRMPHEFVCITDQPDGLDQGIRIVPLWDDHAELGGCFRRLKIFSASMRDVIGPRFAVIDLDAVVVGDITPLFSRPEDFVINAYRGIPGRDPDQCYNGGLMLMTAGARSEVWSGFSAAAVDVIRRETEAGNCKGSDQAWIRMVLGKGEARFTDADGVHEALRIGSTLPEGARIVLFAGRRDPSLSKASWVREHWR